MASPLATNPVSKPGDSLAEGVKTGGAAEPKFQSGARDSAPDDGGAASNKAQGEKAKKEPNA